MRCEGVAVCIWKMQAHIPSPNHMWASIFVPEITKTYTDILKTTVSSLYVKFWGIPHGTTSNTTTVTFEGILFFESCHVPCVHQVLKYPSSHKILPPINQANDTTIAYIFLVRGIVVVVCVSSFKIVGPSKKKKFRGKCNPIFRVLLSFFDPTTYVQFSFISNIVLTL